MTTRLFAISILAVALVPQLAAAHCQVPCGIYDDAARVNQMLEDAQTIAKATANINDLASQGGAQTINQATRWVWNKELHATNIITTVAEYFLTQKVKPVASGADGYDAYLAKLADHHRVMSVAMKCKQNADLAFVEELRSAILSMSRHYDMSHRH